MACSPRGPPLPRSETPHAFISLPLPPAWAVSRFATKNVYVLIYGLLGCIFSASYAYSNGIITTLEKRFKIPSKTIGE